MLTINSLNLYRIRSFRKVKATWGIKMEKKDRLIKEWTESLLVALIITGILYFLLWPMKVEGKSMEPTLHDGNYVLVSRVLKSFSTLERGDIITIELTYNNKKEHVVKRIIATEGEHVEIEEGKVYIDSKPIVEPYINVETLGDVDLYVPKDAYFVLGDNRMVSKDSRSFGCIFEEDIDAKVIKKIF